MKETVAQLELELGGMLYAVTLADGKFVLIDGGIYTAADSARLYRYLKARAEGDIVIAAWLFTHGHYDHVGLASQFLTEHRDELSVERFLYNIPAEGATFPKDDTANGDNARYEKAIFEAFARYPEALVHEVRTGEEFTFSGLTVKVLTTAYDRYPDPPTNRNHTSAIFRLTFGSGRRFMVFGDACGERFAKLLDPTSPIYCPPEELKSDILQVTHHGLAVAASTDYEAVREVYREVAPSVALWPVPAHRFYNDTWCQKEVYIYNRFLLDTLKERNLHHTQTAEIALDDLTISILKV